MFEFVMQGLVYTWKVLPAVTFIPLCDHFKEFG